MNRREALTALAGACAAAGVNIENLKALDGGEIALFVLRTPDRLGNEAVGRIREAWTRAMNGTPLENVRAVILEGGMTIEAIRVRDLQPPTDATA